MGEIDKTDIQAEINDSIAEATRLILINQAREKTLDEMESIARKMREQYTYNEIRISELYEHSERLKKMINSDDNSWIEKDNGSPDFLNPELDLNG